MTKKKKKATKKKATKKPGRAPTRTKHEKRFYELYKDHTPVECARILVDEERELWQRAMRIATARIEGILGSERMGDCK